MEIYVKKISFISIFSLLFWFSNTILSDTLILPVSQLRTQQVMTSLIMPHRIFNTELSYSCAHFVVEINEKPSLDGGF